MNSIPIEANDLNVGAGSPRPQEFWIIKTIKGAITAPLRKEAFISLAVLTLTLEFYIC
jgi:hypothetical protein